MTKKHSKKTGRIPEAISDEIDLTPFINRVLKRKFWILGAVVLSALLGYFVSYAIPAKYAATGTLTFKGYRRIEGVSSDYLQSPLVSATSVAVLLQRINNEDTDEFKEVESIEISGDAYPLTFTMKTTKDASLEEIASSILDYVNESEEVKNEIEGQVNYLTSQLVVVNEKLTEVEDQVQSARQVMFSCSSSSAAMGSAYADLVALEKTLQEAQSSLQQELDTLQGLTYIARPYYTNNGDPVSPNKLKNAVMSAFGVGVVGVGMCMVIKTKDE